MKTNVKEVLTLRQGLGVGKRRYIYNSDALDSYKKEFTYLNDDIKKLRFALDRVGAISDCYILYAVACLGVADVESVRMFLLAMHKKNLRLSIPDTNDHAVIRERMKTLTLNGFLFKHIYVSAATDIDGSIVHINTSLYTIAEDAQQLANQKLGKDIKVNKWIMAKPLYELQGWASSGYCMTYIAAHTKFVKFKQGIFNTKVMGTTIIPGILKCETPSYDEYIGFIPAFLHMEDNANTQEDYVDKCCKTVKTIRQYLYNMDLKKKVARAVVVVEDNADLNEIAKYIAGAHGEIEKDYDRIFFVGEGTFRNNSSGQIKNLFLRMIEDTTKDGYGIIPAEPDFIIEDSF